MALLKICFLFLLSFGCRESAKRNNLPEPGNIAIANTVREEDTLFKTYYPGGVLASCIIKKDSGDIREYHISFYENGMVKEKGHQGYVANKDVATNTSVGVWYAYDSTGRLVSETVYNNDIFAKASIEVRRYHVNGTVSAIEKYNNYILYETEKKQVGEWKYFNEQGKMVKTITQQ
jgi:YD repeat-containing protein